MLLDPFTILVMSTLMAGAMSVVLYSVYRSFPSEIAGIKQWAVGLSLLVLSALIYALRTGPAGGLGQIVPPLCASSLLLWGLGLGMIGTQMFYQRPPTWRLFHLIWGTGVAAVCYWLVIEPDFPARVAIISFLIFVLYSYQVVLIWGYGDRHLSTVFFGLLMLIQALVVLTRGVLAITHDSGDVMMLYTEPYQSLYLGASHLMTLLLTVGFMTVATRRLQLILERRSTMDPLTQVLNRRGFSDVYARESVLMRRESTSMSLLSIDLDYFKKINDCHGHATGDLVLKDVATVIAKVLRASDHLARFGGEEFIVLLPATGLERALQIAERIQQALHLPRAAAHGEQDAQPQPLPPYTVSIGIACQASAEEGFESIMGRADKALYCAKERGRDRIEVSADAVVPLHMARA